MHTLQFECIPYSLNAYPVGIQDFPEGVHQLPKVLLFLKFFAKNCMKMKEFGPPGGHMSLVPPLESTNATLQWTLI